MTILVTGARGHVGRAVLTGLLTAGEAVQAQGHIPQLPAELRQDAVPEILGRPALTFAEWAREHAADFR